MNLHPSLLKRVHPRRDRQPVPEPPELDPCKAFAGLISAYQANRSIWQDIRRTVSPRVARRFDAVDQRLEHGMPETIPEPDDAELEALIFKLVGWKKNDRRLLGPERQAIDYWLATRGPAFAVEVMVAVGMLDLDPIWEIQKVWILYGRRLVDGWVGGLDRLRWRLAAADEAAYAEAREIARRARAEAGSDSRHMLDYLFPTETEWLDEDVAARLALRPAADRTLAAVFLFYSLHDVEQLEHLLRDTCHDLTYGNRLAAVLPSVLHALGDAALHPLAAVLDACEPRDTRSAAKVLAAVDSDRAMELLIGGLEDANRIGGLRAAAGSFPRRAVKMLAPIAAERGRRGKTAATLLSSALRGEPAAAEPLDQLSADARRVVEGLLAELDTGEEAPIEALPEILRTPPWRRRPKMPDFWQAAELPRPRLRDGRRLPLPAVEVLGGILAFSSPDDPYAGLEQILTACDRRSLAEFAWALFEAWIDAGAEAADKWALFALGHLGDDQVAARLVPLISRWPREQAYKRSILALDVLVMIGTDLALGHLQEIARRIRTKTVKAAASEAFDRLAAERGLSAEDLADRLVPDLGLEREVPLELDYGPRRFRVGFDQRLVPFTVDGSGKRRANPPCPGKRDDAELAPAAFQRWKTLKKGARTVARQQIPRLKHAMCERRRWRGDDFQRLFIDHPLLTHLVTRLLWGVYDAEDRLAETFRVADDRTCADADDEPWELTADAAVGLVHRLDLDDELLERWQRTWSDYELLPPFAQLDREVFRPDDGERSERVLRRIAGTRVPAGRIIGLESWRRGEIEDGGLVSWMAKPCADGVHQICIGFEPGIFIDGPSRTAEQTLGEVSIGLAEDAGYGEPALTFGELPEIAFSELIRELKELRRER